MCTFCGRVHNETPRNKIIRIYGKNDKYLGMKSVATHMGVRDYQKGLYVKYPDWEYTTESSN